MKSRVFAILSALLISQGANAAEIITVDFAPGTFTSPGIYAASSKGFFFQSGTISNGSLSVDPGSGLIILRGVAPAPGFEDARAFRLISATFTAPTNQDFFVFGIGYKPGGGYGQGARSIYSGPSGTISSGPDAYGYLYIGATSNFTMQLDNLVFAVVPETQSWTLMISGFGLIGFAARKRHTTSAIAAAV